MESHILASPTKNILAEMSKCEEHDKPFSLRLLNLPPTAPPGERMN
jgi:hypothetical protein